MKSSKYLRAAVLVAMVAALAGVPTVSAFADIKGAFDVSPATGVLNQETAYSLTYDNQDGSTNIDPVGNKPTDDVQCLVYTLTGFTISPTPTPTLTTTPLAGRGPLFWTTTVTANTVTAKANPPAADNALRDGESAKLDLKATPIANATHSISMTAWANVDCATPNTTSFSKNIAVNQNLYSAAIQPTTSGPSQTQGYSLTMTTGANVTDKAKTASITVPVGWSVDGTTIHTSVSAPCATADAWGSLATHLSGSTITVTNAGGGTCELGSSQTLTVTFTATAPGVAGTSTWVTDLRRDGPHVFTNTAADPAVTVNKFNANTGVVCAPNPITVGSSTTCTGTVTSVGGGGTPAGTLTWSTGNGGFTGSPCNLTGGACSVTYTPTSAGSPVVTATYGGDATHNGGSQGSTTVTVNSPGLTNTTTTPVCTPNPVTVGAGSTCTATVAGGSTPAGTVAWSSTGSGGLTPTSCPLNASAQCSVTFSSPVVETDTVTATYGGDGTHNGSFGTTSVAVIAAAKNGTTTSIACVPGTPVVNTATNCTVTTTDIGPGALSNPTGPVNLSSDGAGAFSGASCTLGAQAGSTSVSTCQATYTPSATGGQTLTATYPGDAGHNGSNGTTTISVQAGGGTPHHYQPDGLIRRLQNKAFLGDNIFNGTGNHQTTGAKCRRGQHRASLVKIQNDGDAVDNIIVSAPGQRPPGFRIRYFHGTQEITSKVASHTFVVQNLAPGATFTMRVVITVLRHAPLGTVRAWYIELRSQNDPTKRDVLKMKIHVPAPRHHK
jgi:hypothetical protein